MPFVCLTKYNSYIRATFAVSWLKKLGSQRAIFTVFRLENSAGRCEFACNHNVCPDMNGKKRKGNQINKKRGMGGKKTREKFVEKQKEAGGRAESCKKRQKQIKSGGGAGWGGGNIGQKMRRKKGMKKTREEKKSSG